MNGKLSISIGIDKLVDYITPLELCSLLTSGTEDTVRIIDVRTMKEREDGYISGSISLPYHDHFNSGASISEETLSLISPASKSSTSSEKRIHIVFHCMYSAERGPRAARLFARTLDIKESMNIYIHILKGGFHEWINEENEISKSLTESYVKENWIKTDIQGLIWKGDIELQMM